MFVPQNYKAMQAVARKWVGIWLLTGCLMVFFQVIVGGVTRLTESGLSITEWKPVKGIVPPLNEKEWLQEFELYQKLTQYKTINEGMSLDEFKWIYFWEYFHRFWARFMGFVFIIPFTFFWLKGWFDAALKRKIGLLFVWGGVIGFYGWVMVKSGLTGVYVPPFHLSIHLLLAISLLGYLVYMTTSVWRIQYVPVYSEGYDFVRKALWWVLPLLMLQIFLGGNVSGMKAGLAYPTWPDMNGSIIPKELFTLSPSLDGFFQYDARDFWGRTFIQFTHRLVAYTLFLVVLLIYAKGRLLPGDKPFRVGMKLLPFTITLQVVIGIVTVLNCVGKIPVFWGVMHQVGVMLFIAAWSFVLFHFPAKKQ